MKYAILMVLNYSPSEHGISRIPTLQGTINDLSLMMSFCLAKGIERENITIITDLLELPNCCSGTNAKKCNGPDCRFICSEFCNFIENTIRGIETNYSSDFFEVPEVFIYFSCHGSELKMFNRIEQALVLTDVNGSLMYLSTKNIFDILFGRNYISDLGIIKIPIYRKEKFINVHEDKILEMTQITKEEIIIEVPIPTKSPENFEVSRYRSSYFSNRGIPASSRVLLIVDTCHSGGMTHFPFIYSPSEQRLIKSKLFNKFVNHIDMPYCVCISSCEIDKFTKSNYEGSQLTRIFVSLFLNYRDPLNIIQMYHSIINNIEFHDFIVKKTVTPIISTTGQFIEVPFFSNDCMKFPKLVIK